MRNIAVIGAGWSGLSAALALQKQGYQVTLYERSPKLLGVGGRACTAYRAGDKAPFAIDNGQHVLLAAYTHTLAALNSVGVDIDNAFLRLPAHWQVPNQFKVTLPSWGDAHSPNGLRAKGLLKRLPLLIAMLCATVNHQAPTWQEQLSRLKAAIRLLIDSPQPHETVNQWLARLKFPAPFDTALWQPLCYATLNTPPNVASAVTFKRVIQDGLLSGSYQAAMLVPREDLGATLPSLALKQLNTHGASLQLGVAVESIAIDGQQLWVQSRHTRTAFDGIVCATTAKDAVRLLPTSCTTVALNAMAAQATQPITTIHLKFSNIYNNCPTLLPAALLIMPEPCETDTHTHMIQNAVVLDRAYLASTQIGWLTVVLSCSHQAIQYSKQFLITATATRLIQVFPDLKQATVLDGIVIHAKQATFSCEAGLNRPDCTTAHPAIVLAGDYLHHPSTNNYPATLEGAVRSGQLAANVLMHALNTDSYIKDGRKQLIAV
jgi:hydroxysqualene dehydroxylase